MRKKRPKKSRKLRVGDVIKFNNKNLNEWRAHWHLHNSRRISSIGSSEWVVTFADTEGTHNSWHVLARRLSSTGIYNPRGVILDFYQSGNFHSNKIISPIDLVGRMKITFLRVE